MHRLTVLLAGVFVFFPQISAAATQAFSYTGSNQTFTVPEGVTSVTVKIWGAGGGAGNLSAGYSWVPRALGGAGGYTLGAISVTPGQEITVIVGQGGSTLGGATYGGGGSAGAAWYWPWDGTHYGSSGGGRSAVRVGGVETMTAGGGGGGGSLGGAYRMNNVFTYENNTGGGLNGGNGLSVTYAEDDGYYGRGGSQTEAGQYGSQFQGAHAYAAYGGYTTTGSGAGGGGWYGGGTTQYMYGGGGGSGHCGSGATGCSTTAGSYQTPPATGDADYPGGSVGYASGGHGFVKIIWTEPPALPPVISGPTTRAIDESGTYSFQNTATAGVSVRYGVDWDMNGVVDEWVPATDTVSSGTSQSTTHTWTSTGSKTFRALTQNSDGTNSSWVSYTVTVTEEAPTVLLTSSVDTYRDGDDPFTLEWSSSNATSCTSTDFDTDNDTSGEATITSITDDTTFTVTCEGAGGEGEDAVEIEFTENSAPDAPSISGVEIGTQNVSYDHTYQSADPEGDTLRYGISWDNNSSVDEWVPASGYVSSNASRFSSHSFNTIGAHTFRVLAQDDRGANSAWSYHTITLAPACIPQNVCDSEGTNVVSSCSPTTTIRTCEHGCVDNACAPFGGTASGGGIMAIPSIVRVGQTTTISWSVIDAVSCTISEDNPILTDTWTDTGSGSVTGSHESGAIVFATTYTIRCDDEDEDDTEDDYEDAVVVNIVPVFQEQ